MRIGWRALWALLGFLLWGCAPPTASFQPEPEQWILFQENPARLVLFQGLQQRESFDLPLPPGCAGKRLLAAPRGQRLALEIVCASGPQVLRWDAQRKVPHDATASWAQDAHLLGWSTDGQAVYLRVNSLGDPHLVRWEWEGKVRTLPLSPFTYHVDESQDGRLLFALTQGVGWGSALYVWQGGRATLLRREPLDILSGARWSPDGKRIAAIRFPDSTVPFPSGELILLEGSNGAPRRLAEADAGQGLMPLWSADGRWIAFARRDGEGDPPYTELWAVEVQSGRLWPLTSWQETHLLDFRLSPQGTLALVFEQGGKRHAGLTDWSGAPLLLAQAEEICCLDWIR